MTPLPSPSLAVNWQLIFYIPPLKTVLPSQSSTSLSPPPNLRRYIITVPWNPWVCLICLLQFFLSGKLTKNGKKLKRLHGDYHPDVSLGQTNESGRTPKRKSYTGRKIETQYFISFYACNISYTDHNVWWIPFILIKMCYWNLKLAIVFDVFCFFCWLLSVFYCHIFQNAENLDCLTFDCNIL